MIDIDQHMENQLKKLQSPKARTRYEACEFLRAAPIITPEAKQSLRKAFEDPNPFVAEAAQRALAVHLAHEPSPNVEKQAVQTSWLQDWLLIIIAILDSFFK